MVRNRFEQVDEVQPDAITLSLWKAEDQSYGKVTCPAALTNGRQVINDMISDDMPVKDAFRSAVRLANELKAAMVVMDPDSLWEAGWGDLFHPVDD